MEVSRNQQPSPLLVVGLDRKVRLLCRKTATKADGKPVIKIGMCFGYWPCLKAPYVQISIGTQVIDLWYGMPSYKKQPNV